jgi:ribosomal protein S20
MADLNALIARGYQFQPLPDPFAQYGKMQQLQNAGIQNQLTQQQLAAVQRAEAQTNALNEAYRQNTSPDTGEINYSGVRNYLSQQGAGSQIPALEKQRMELATQKLTQQKLEGEIGSSGFDLKIKKANKAITDIASLNSPEEAIASIDAHVKKGDIDSDKAAQLKSMLNSAPSFGAWQKSMVFNILDAKERLTADLAREGQGVTMRGQDIGATTAAAGQAVTARGQDIGATTAREGQAVTARGQDIGAATATRGQDIGAATATRGQDIGAATATRGQDIGAATATRGQDIGATTAREGQAVQIRGQDLVLSPAQLAQKMQLAGAGATRVQTNVNAFTPASEEAQRDFIKSSRATYDTLKNAPGTLKNIEEAKKLIPSAKGFMGPGGESLLDAASFLNNRLGTSINTKGITDASELRSRLFQGIIENLRKLDANPTENQQNAMRVALGNIGTDPNALPAVLDSFADTVRSKVEMHNAEVSGAMARGVKFPYDPTVKLPSFTPPPPSGASLIPGSTPAAAGGGATVTLPDGRIKTFPNADAANKFKKAAGL